MTQLDSEIRTIGAHKFTVFKLPPFDAQDVLIDIGQVIAPAIGKAAKVFGNTKAESVFDMDVEDPSIASGVAELMRGITKPKMRELINTMAGVSHCDGVPLRDCMEIVFRGNLPLMYQWLWFALEVNFKNFTVWLGTATKGVLGLKAAVQSQTTSQGTGQQ